jgi:FkbH-like protein
MSGAPTQSPTALERLATPGLQMSELMALVARIERETPPPRSLAFGVSANVTVEVLETYLRRQALLDGYRAVVHVGSYEDHLGNVQRFREAGVEVIVLLNLMDNLLPSLEARLPTMDDAAFAALRRKLQDEMQLVLEAARGTSQVFLGLWHRYAPPSAAGLHARPDAAVEDLNQVLREQATAHPNVRLLQPAEIIAQLGWARAFSPRFYFRYRAPYTAAFFEELALQISRASRGAGSYFYKALVVDADNTLWGGIAGEDLPEELKLGPHDYPGSIYWYAQQEFLALQKHGVLLCLCSKNNPADVDAVLANHPEMVLRAQHFAAQRVNWGDKVTNVRRLASDLDIGLDAIVYLDDSAFECEAVRGQLPMVRTLQVPANVYEYPALVQHVKELFLAGGISSESAAKTEQYRVRGLAKDERKRFASQEEYLASLGVRVEVRLGEQKAIKRIAELTQKSSQFNLTTRRYAEGQIRDLLESAAAEVYSIHVSDKFGDSGLTGVVIFRYEGEEVNVDTCLLSCRVIGRGVEFSFWRPLFKRAAARGIQAVRAEYLATAKNAQVRDFYDRLGLALVSDGKGQRGYRATLGELQLPTAPHIEVVHDC